MVVGLAVRCVSISIAFALVLEKASIIFLFANLTAYYGDLSIVYPVSAYECLYFMDLSESHLSSRASNWFSNQISLSTFCFSFISNPKNRAMTQIPKQLSAFFAYITEKLKIV